MWCKTGHLQNYQVFEVNGHGHAGCGLAHKSDPRAVRTHTLRGPGLEQRPRFHNKTSESEERTKFVAGQRKNPLAGTPQQIPGLVSHPGPPPHFFLAESGSCTEKSHCHVPTEPITLNPQSKRWSRRGHRHLPLEKRTDRAGTVRRPSSSTTGHRNPPASQTARALACIPPGASLDLACAGKTTMLSRRTQTSSSHANTTRRALPPWPVHILAFLQRASSRATPSLVAAPLLGVPSCRIADLPASIQTVHDTQIKILTSTFRTKTVECDPISA